MVTRSHLKKVQGFSHVHVKTLSLAGEFGTQIKCRASKFQKTSQVFPWNSTITHRVLHKTCDFAYTFLKHIQLTPCKFPGKISLDFSFQKLTKPKGQMIPAWQLFGNEILPTHGLQTCRWVAGFKHHRWKKYILLIEKLKSSYNVFILSRKISSRLPISVFLRENTSAMLRMDITIESSLPLNG